jgi:hypothetical protein
MMKKALCFILILVIAPAAYATVSTRVCRADGNTLLELADPGVPFVYRPIMAGTHLTIIVSSDTSDYVDDSLYILDANQDYGRLYGRGPYNEDTGDWEGSHLPAAGEMAAVMYFQGNLEVDGQEYDARGFEFFSDPDAAIPGDWFIVDYNAISAGPCAVAFYDSSIDWLRPQYQIYFTFYPG